MIRRHSLLRLVFFMVAVLVVAVLRPASAETWPGPYAATVVKVTDGDTVVVRFAEGPCERGPCVASVWSIRIAGIDTPEKKLCRDWQALPARLPTMSPARRTKAQSCAWGPA